MAWDAEHFVVIGAALVGAGGATVAGWINSGRQAKSQYRLAMRTAKVTAYEEALRHCEHMLHWAVSTYPIFQEGEALTVPVSPVEDQIRARVLVNLHGSPDVRLRYYLFEKEVNDFYGNAKELRRDTEQNRPELWADLQKSRKAIREQLDWLVRSTRDDIDLLPGSWTLMMEHRDLSNTV